MGQGDSTRLFLVVMLVLTVLGGVWGVTTQRRAAEYRAACLAARAAMPSMALHSAELAKARTGPQLDDQAAIRKFMMFQAGLTDVDVRVEERDDGEQTVRTFTVRLPRHTRRQAFAYAYNVRRRVSAVRLTEIEQDEIAGKSLRPHDQWRWRLVFTSRSGVGE